MNVLLRIDGPPPSTTHAESTREFNARGFFVIGPQMMNPSDVLARMIAERHCANGSATPENERRQRVRYRGRLARRRHGLGDLVRRLTA